MTAEVAVVPGPPRRNWWPLAALAVLLLVVAGSLVSQADVEPLESDAKAAFVDTAPMVAELEGVEAPVPTVSPDPKTFVQQIEIILPPPPPPVVKRSGGGGSLNKADASKFCANINAQREANGLSALGSCYATSARQAHANAMVAAFTGDHPTYDNIWHSGDNIVGVAGSHGALINAFMESPGHRDQILTSDYVGAYVGCAWRVSSGLTSYLFCTADFYK